MSHQNLQKSMKSLDFRQKNCYFIHERILLFYLLFCYFIREHIFMVFTDKTFKFFSVLQSNVRAALASSPSDIPYAYEGESFFKSYEILQQIWSQKNHREKLPNQH